jgi:hypothetical protein
MNYERKRRRPSWKRMWIGGRKPNAVAANWATPVGIAAAADPTKF